MNHVAVIVAIVVHYALGAIWYGIWGQQWIVAAGLTAEQIKAVQSGGAATPYIISAVAHVVFGYGLAWLIRRLGENTAAGGAKIGALVAICFVAAFQALNYGFQMKPLALWLIDAGYPLIGMIIMGAILGGWRKKA
jgi:hypothetical protein